MNGNVTLFVVTHFVTINLIYAAGGGRGGRTRGLAGNLRMLILMISLFVLTN